MPILIGRYGRGRRTFQAHGFLFNMSKCAECTSWTITGVLYIVTFGRFVDFRMKLLFSPRMAILAGITGLTDRGIAPLVSRLDIGTGSGSVNKRIKISFPIKIRIIGCTCICISWDCDVCPCCCEIEGKRSPVGTTLVAFCRVPSCNWPRRRWCPATWDHRSTGNVPYLSYWGRSPGRFRRFRWLVILCKIDQKHQNQVFFLFRISAAQCLVIF